jgi:hypothetical protein
MEITQYRGQFSPMGTPEKSGGLLEATGFELAIINVHIGERQCTLPSTQNPVPGRLHPPFFWAKYSIISRVLWTIASANSKFLFPMVFAALYSVHGGLATISWKYFGGNSAW